VAAAKVPRTPHASLETEEGRQASNTVRSTARAAVVLTRLYFERSDALECAWLAPGELKPTPCHDELQHGRCLPGPHTCLLRLIACRMGQGLLVIEHRTEIAPCLRCCVMQRFFLAARLLARRKLLRRKAGSARIQVARSRATEL